MRGPELVLNGSLTNSFRGWGTCISCQRTASYRGKGHLHIAANEITYWTMCRTDRDKSFGRIHLVPCANRMIPKVTNSARMVCFSDSEGWLRMTYGIHNAIRITACAMTMYVMMASFSQFMMMAGRRASLAGCGGGYIAGEQLWPNRTLGSTYLAIIV
jgi:hypothetical protein